MAFGFESTADEVLRGIDLHGKFAVVTGGTTGLGLETCRALVSADASVLCTARDNGRGTTAVAHIRELYPDADINYALLELDDLTSVRRFAENLLRTCDRVDILINNAGIMGTPFARTKDGFERQFGTNHLGHFVLTTLLMPALVKAAPSRVICLSSAGHHWGGMLWDDPNFEQRDYDKWLAYGQSKTANALFAMELDRRFAMKDVHAFAVHPGAIHTDLARHFEEYDRAAIANTMRQAGVAIRRKSLSQGAATTLWSATAAELVDHGGAYLEDCQVAEPKEAGLFAGRAPWLDDPEGAARLWTMSERMAGEKIGIA